jgi:hypothetical protein
MTWQLHPSSRFADHVATRDALQRASTDTPFLESAFLAPLLAEFGSGRECIAFHHGAAGIDAAAILEPLGGGRWQTIQPSQLPLGAWLCRPEADLGAQMQGLMRALPGIVLGLGATQLDPRLVARPESSDALRTMDYIRTSYLDVSGSFDDYWEARGKNLRQNTRKQRNKLQAEGTETHLECITRPADVAAAVADYGVLESAGWKADNGTAIQADNAQGRFYRAMLENFCAVGRGRIYRYRFGEKVVAMDLCIDNGPLVVILKTAYDETYRQVSPSTLMRQEQFRAWWEERRYQRIEFYGKTLEWHTRWTSTERELFHATAYRWPWLGRLHARRLARQTQGSRVADAAAPAGEAA